MRSELRQVEVFITSDGEEFLDDSAALEHEEFLEAKDAFRDLVDCDENEVEYVVGKMRPYLEHIMRKLDNV